MHRVDCVNAIRKWIRYALTGRQADDDACRSETREIDTVQFPRELVDFYFKVS